MWLDVPPPDIRPMVFRKVRVYSRVEYDRRKTCYDVGLGC
jgi:hypothetical protein